MRVRAAHLAAVFTLLAFQGRAGASDLDRVAAGPVDEVVAAATAIAARRDNEVLLFEDGGRLLGRCAPTEQPPAAATTRRTPRHPLEAEEVLRAADLPDDDLESPEAEEALDEEDLLPVRRARPAPVAAAVVPRALAADLRGDAIWIATSDGLWRTGRDRPRCARVALPGRDLRLVAAAGQTVAATSDTTVWRAVDGGILFEVAAVLSSAPRALIVLDDGGDDGGLTLVADDEALLAITRGRVVRRLLDRRVDALVACGDTVLALAADGAYLGVPDRALARVGDRPPARAALCGTGNGPRWLAAGSGLWTSDDGATWDAWPDNGQVSGLSIGAGVVSGGRLWLATDGGLLTGAAEATTPAWAGAGAAADAVSTWPARAGHPGTAWSKALPRITVAFGARRQTAGRDGWQAWLLLTFPLGHAPPNAADAAAVAATEARRRAELIIDHRRLTAQPPDDERGAWLRATADALEGLP